MLYLLCGLYVFILIITYALCKAASMDETYKEDIK